MRKALQIMLGSCQNYAGAIANSMKSIPGILPGNGFSHFRRGTVSFFGMAILGFLSFFFFPNAEEDKGVAVIAAETGVETGAQNAFMLMSLELRIRFRASSDMVESGEVFQYKIGYSTVSPTLAANNAVITVPLPAGMDLLAFQGTADVESWEIVGSDLVIQMIDPLPAGSAGLMEMEVVVPEGTVCDGTLVETNATFTASNADNSPAGSENASTLITAPNPWDISLIPVSIAPPGFTSIFGVQIAPVSSTGYQALANVDVVVAIDPATTYVPGSCTGGCTTNAAMDTLYWSVPSVTGPIVLNYSVDVPNTVVPGDNLNQNIVYDSEYANNCPGTPPAGDEDLVTPIPVPVNEISCGGPSLSIYEIDSSGVYCGSFSNSGNFFEDNFEVRFDLHPALQLDSIHPVAYNINGLNVDVYYTTNNIPTPTLLGSYVTDLTPMGAFQPPALGGGDWVTAVIYDFGTVPPGFSVSGNACLGYSILSTDQNGDPVVGANPRISGLNCSGGSNAEGYTCLTATLTVSADGLADEVCVSDAVARTPPEGPSNLSKGTDGSASIQHGDTIQYTLRFQNCGGTGSFMNVALADVLPPNLEYDPTKPITYSNNLPAPTTFNYDAGSRTLNWTWNTLDGPPPGTRCGDFFEIYYYCYVPLGTPPQALTNCYDIDWDGSDLSGEPGGAGTPLPAACATVTVQPVVQVESRKGVKGDCDLDYIFFDPTMPPGDPTMNNFNGIARTFAGGDAAYILEIVNTGNLIVDEFVLIDILPWVGDITVSANFDRESEWRPNQFMDLIVPPNTNVFYSIEPNPCRTEFDPPFSPPGCTGPQWTTVKPADNTEIQSIKLEFDFEIDPLDTVRIFWDMKAPFGTPTDLVAWNSFAYQGRSVETDELFIVAEPNKVGIVVKDLDPATVSVGNYVWVDQNMNGIQDELPEDGVNDIGVYLWNVGPDMTKGTPDDFGVDTTVTGNDYNGDPGYYLFSNLPANNEYYVIFELDSIPAGALPTTQDVPGDDTIDSDADPVMGMTGTTGIMNPGDQDITLDMGITPTGCEIFPTIRVICNNGNDCTAGDDNYTVEITVNRELNNIPADNGTYNLRASNDILGDDFDIDVALEYGTTYTYGPYSIPNGEITYVFRDTDDQTCASYDTIQPPAPLNFVGGAAGISATDCVDNGGNLEYDLTVNYVVGSVGEIPANSLVEITFTESGNTQSVLYPAVAGAGSHTFTGLSCDGDDDVAVTLQYVEDAFGNAPIADVCGSVCIYDEPCYVDVEDIIVTDNCRTTGTYNVVVIATVYNFNGNVTVSGFSPSVYPVSGIEGTSQVIASITQPCDGIMHTVTVAGSPTSNSSCLDAGMFEGPRDRDYGDLLNSYGTTNAGSGPYHFIFNDIFLGECVDSELDGAPDTEAGTGATGGDDNTAGGDVTCAQDDEDGITIPMLVAGVQTDLDFTVTNTSGLDAKLVVYLDWDNDQDLTDGNEMYSAIVPTGAVGSTVTIPVTPPTDAILNKNIGVRVRFSTHQAGTMSPTGVAFDGEVEDYIAMVMGFDYGDLADGASGTGEDNYQTNASDNGPSHKIVTNSSDQPTLKLGTSVDPEPDGTPSSDANGDDNVDFGDEDGVSLPMFVAGVATTVDFDLMNMTGGDAKLTLFIDWNNNGDFTDPGEMYSTTVGDAAATASLAVTPPVDAVLNQEIGVRVRLSTDATASMSPTGPAPDGEVEDYLTSVMGFDYGDLVDGAPGTGTGDYETLAANGGPSHKIVTDDNDNQILKLGASVDAEDDGAPSAADGDDNLTSDDEDGITLPMLVVGEAIDLDFTVMNMTGVDAKLTVFIDWNNNGILDDAGEMYSTTVSPGDMTATISVTPPVDAVLNKDLGFRARLSTDMAAAMDPNGPAPDGEVEDYLVSVMGFDLGDLADATGGVGEGEYETLEANNGPSHKIVTDANDNITLKMGATVDGEADGAPSADADGDDTTDSDDEDGVTLPMFAASVPTTVDVDVMNMTGVDAKLTMFIDWNNNGDLTDAGEMYSATVSPGDVTASLAVTPPVDAVINKEIGVRFRLSTDATASMSPTGPAPDGEVEDYETVVMGFDYGDLADAVGGTGAGNYETLAANGGAVHKISTDANDNVTLKLGAIVDAEADGAPSANADGDDNLTSDDEDSVTFPVLWRVQLPMSTLI
jgi:uncharacterized repeat protein (TIGR01451 family)